jgi:hypothetical protein|nr:MAG TPA: hypothetical protein [Caudoviricetes sp.]
MTTLNEMLENIETKLEEVTSHFYTLSELLEYKSECDNLKKYVDTNKVITLRLTQGLPKTHYMLTEIEESFDYLYKDLEVFKKELPD